MIYGTDVLSKLLLRHNSRLGGNLFLLVNILRGIGKERENLIILTCHNVVGNGGRRSGENTAGQISVYRNELVVVGDLKKQILLKILTDPLFLAAGRSNKAVANLVNNLFLYDKSIDDKLNLFGLLVSLCLDSGELLVEREKLLIRLVKTIYKLLLAHAGDVYGLLCSRTVCSVSFHIFKLLN